MRLQDVVFVMGWDPARPTQKRATRNPKPLQRSQIMVAAVALGFASGVAPRTQTTPSIRNRSAV